MLNSWYTDIHEIHYSLMSIHMFILESLTERERQLFKRGIVAFFLLINILILVCVGFLMAYINKIIQGDEVARPQLSVSGEGKIFVRPDIATFMATVVTDAARVGDAQNQNTSRSNAIIDFLKKNNIQEKDIKTTNYSIQPQYRYDKRLPCPLSVPFDESIPCTTTTNVPRIVSYTVRHSLEIRIRDLNKVDDMLQAAVSAGANEVGSILFAVEDEKVPLALARKQAIEDAQKKALILARDLGVRITKIAGFSESGGGPIYYNRGFTARAMEKDAAPAPQVEPGEQEVSSNVTITYEFK